MNELKYSSGFLSFTLFIRLSNSSASLRKCSSWKALQISSNFCVLLPSPMSAASMSASGGKVKGLFCPESLAPPFPTGDDMPSLANSVVTETPTASDVFLIHLVGKQTV